MNSKKVTVIILMLLSMSLSWSCVSLAQESLLPQEYRTYDLICGKPYQGFQYTFNKCTKRIFGKCIKAELAVLEIKAKFDDLETYQELCHKNFVLSVRRKPVNI